MILLGATVISVLMGEAVEALTIVVIVLVNAILGFLQEYKTEKTLEALKNMAAPTAKVIRDGKEAEIPGRRHGSGRPAGAGGGRPCAGRCTDC